MSSIEEPSDDVQMFATKATRPGMNEMDILFDSAVSNRMLCARVSSSAIDSLDALRQLGEVVMITYRGDQLT